MGSSLHQRNRFLSKSNGFEWLVTASLISIFLLVIVTAIVFYFRLGSIIDTVKSGIRPDRKLILVKEIMNDLSEAENNVKTYTLTRDENQLLSFYRLTGLTGEKVEEFRNLWAGDTLMAPTIDTLDQLVEEKYTLLDQLLVIQDEFRVEQAMQEVMQSIRMRETLPPEVTAIDTLHEEQARKKENFFSRLFRSKKKARESDITDSINISIAPDTLTPMEEIGKQVEAVRQQVESKESRIRIRELELLAQNQEVMQRIRKLLTFLEEREAASLQVHFMQAEQKAGEIKLIIMSFVLAASLLLLLSALVIYRYIRKNEEYRAIMNKAREDALALAGAKELFLANMSHEIRTPMNIISGFLNQVMKGPLEDEQREKLEIIRKSSDHLLRLLNDLLDLSKLQAHKLDLVETRFSPKALVDEVYQSLNPAASAKKLRLRAVTDPEIPATVYGDEARIRQILLNLAGNAIKFTDEGEVAIRAFHLKGRDNHIRIAFEVSDTGRGMEDDDLQKVFDAFEKGSVSTGKNDEGAGLGLSITKKLVDLLGGALQAESHAGKGSVFRAEIPFRQADEQALPHLATEPADLSSLHGSVILVVDDEEFNRRLVKVILEKYGCRVEESANAEQAIAMVKDRHFDLVLMDIRMPGLDGPEAASVIKKFCLDTGQQLPVIAVSAAIDKNNLITYREKGMDDFIHKPFTEETLLKMVIRYLDRPVQRIDLEPLKLNSAGNETFFREMVGLFLRDTEAGLIQIHESLAENDRENVSALAHKISSPCKHLRAEKLYGLLKRLEVMAKQPAEARAIADVVDRAKSEFDLIKNEIMNRSDLKDLNPS